MDTNTKDVLVTLVTVIGSVASLVFAGKSRRHADRAVVAKDAAIEASLKPPRMPTRMGPSVYPGLHESAPLGANPGITFIDLEDEDGPADTPRDPSAYIKTPNDRK